MKRVKYAKRINIITKNVSAKKLQKKQNLFSLQKKFSRKNQTLEYRTTIDKIFRSRNSHIKFPKKIWKF